jgi:DNA-binding transcriptional regulator/RsmH inhibitor MraZ
MQGIDDSVKMLNEVTFVALHQSLKSVPKSDVAAQRAILQLLGTVVCISKIDEQGRFSFPPELKKIARIEKDCAFIATLEGEVMIVSENRRAGLGIGEPLAANSALDTLSKYGI